MLCLRDMSDGCAVFEGYENVCAVPLKRTEVCAVLDGYENDRAFLLDTYKVGFAVQGIGK